MLACYNEIIIRHMGE